MQIIGIDIGTTTISGAVLEYENEKTVKLLEAKTIENCEHEYHHAVFTPPDET